MLDHSHPECDGEPVSAIDPQHIDLLDPNFDTYGLNTKRAINGLSSLADAQQPPPMTLLSLMPITQTNHHNVKSETPD